MAKTIAFTASTPFSPSIAQQDAAFAGADHILRPGRIGPTDIAKSLKKYRITLEAGDTIAFYDPRCLAVSTGTLIRLLHYYVERGITVEFIQPAFRLHQNGPDQTACWLLAMLDHHWRFMHAVETSKGVKQRTGRRPRLTDNDLAAVQTKLAAPGATMAGVARDLGVGRSTLYDFLQRHGLPVGT